MKKDQADDKDKDREDTMTRREFLQLLVPIPKDEKEETT